MKPRRVILFTLLSFTFVLAARMTAQTLTAVYSFNNGSIIGSVTNWGSGSPPNQLILSGNTLYGTTQYGGSWQGNGTVFAVNTDGTGFINLHSFTAVSDGTNSDGASPSGRLILSGNTLYGTAVGGGSFEVGTVFAVNTDGTGFTNLHNFSGTNGAYPSGGLILSGTTLYGTASQGGSSGAGAIFAINTDGTGFTNLYKFTFTSFPDYTNSDGSYLAAGLILSGNTLYGTAMFGGSAGNGTVFAINTDGTGFTNLHSFTAGVGYPNITNSDGANPWGGLIVSGNTVYGTASSGGSSANGTVFAVNTDGTGFTNLHSLTYGSEGAAPEASLILSGNTLYGTASSGGSLAGGTVFAINTDGSGFTNLHSFRIPSIYSPYTSDGAFPHASLISSGNTLYGTASRGGSFDSGTIFSLSFPPRLTILPFGANVILTWPTNVAGFALQSTTNPVSPAVWTSNSLVPVVVNGQNTVTNPISGNQQFFRLSQFP